MIRAVLFDWGDTLMRVELDPDLAADAAAAGLLAVGEREDLPDVEALVAAFADDAAASVEGDDERPFDAAARDVFAALGAGLSADELDRYLVAVHDVWERSFAVAAHAHALLDALRDRGLRTGLVSNSVTPRRWIEPVLARQGLVERLDAIVLSADVGKRKPHPAAFERALAELGVEAAEAVFVGDRLLQDVAGAGRLGMTTVQALWFRADEDGDGVEPDVRAFTPHDVLNAVRRLTGES